MKKFNLHSIIVKCFVIASLLFVSNVAYSYETCGNGWACPAGTSDTGGYSGWHGYTGHVGADFYLAIDSPVLAISEGIIVRYSSSSVGYYGTACGDVGGAIIVEHEGVDSSGNTRTFYALYGHNYIESGLEVGDPVEKGQIIARTHRYVGKYDYETTCTREWPHLHFGIRPDSIDPNAPYRGVGTSTNDYGWVDPLEFLNNYRPSSGSLEVYDFWKIADPVYADPSSNIWHPNFDAQYKIRNNGSEEVTIQRLALAIHRSDNSFWFDMSSPSTGQPRYYDNITLYPGQSHYFDFSVAYFTSPGTFKVVAKAQMTDGTWNELDSMDFFVQPSQTPTCSVGSISMNGTVSGSWSSTCASTHRTGSYARYYAFTLGSSASVTIDLESGTDPYMYLLGGSGTGGSVIASDDDGGEGTNSRITRTLSAGTYTIEATTYSSAATGSFTLRLGGGTTPPPAQEICNDGTDNDGDGRIDCNDSDCSGSSYCQTPPCSVGSISMNGTVSGTWSSTCASTHRTGSYARYYAFTLGSSASVTIDLESGTDPFMYLLGGSGTGGSVIASDDDGGEGTNSRITRTLSAGTYTIEATTYSSSATGSFTLRLSSGTPPPVQEVCNDGTDNDGDGRIDCNDSDCSGSSYCQTPPCSVGSISMNGTVSGTWSSTCASTHRTGSYARYYAFTLGSSASVTIDLESGTDPYMYLLGGSGTGGSVITSDDDGGDGTNSRITWTLSAGTYTIEATTYSSAATGSFTLRLGAGGSSCTQVEGDIYNSNDGSCNISGQALTTGQFFVTNCFYYKPAFCQFV